MKTLTMNPIDVCTPRQSLIANTFVHQARALDFEFSRNELSRTSLMIQSYTGVSTEVYPYTLSTCATNYLIAPGSERRRRKVSFVPHSREHYLIDTCPILPGHQHVSDNIPKSPIQTPGSNSPGLIHLYRRPISPIESTSSNVAKVTGQSHLPSPQKDGP